MSTSNNYAFVTLVTSDSYLPGALAVAGALKDLHPNSSDQEIRFQLVCLVTPETVDVSTIKQLRSAFDLVVGVEVISQEDETGLKLLGRLDLDTVLTKLHVFRLVQFSKLIFLDADVLPIRPLSHLFTLSHDFSAVPDVGWPDIFNSGFMVLTPGEQKFAELIELFNSKGSWDGGDQGLLNEWRGNDWNRLSFIYNTTPTAAYTYAPAYERFGSQISNIHFIGPNKPWNSLGHRTPFTSPLSIPSESSQQAYNYDRLVDRWYDVYDRHYRAHEDTQSSLFQETHYESVWNTKGISRETSESQPSTTSSLSLDELKRVAIEGLGASRAAPYDYKASAAGPQHGEYWTMPLEGRIDLIRPKPKSKVQDFAYSEEGSSLQNQNSPEVWIDSSEEDWKKASAAQRGQQQGGMSNSRLGTPGPNEVPPSPYLRTVDLPPATPTPRYIRQQYFASESSADEQYPGEGGGSVHRQSRTSSHDRHQRPGSRGYDHGHHRAHEAQHGHSHQHGHRHNSPSQDHLRDEHAQPQRPFSPPMLVWNPAVDPPPTTQPPASTFPTDTYYPNTWDTPPSHSTHPNSKDYPRFPQSHSAPDSQALFEPLPQPGIPESLLRQGHYRNVTGEEQLGATPSPDRTKVKHIFPWEDKPRHMPGRVFPAADSPRPSLFLSPESQASQTSSSEMPTTPEQRPSRQALGHVPGSVVALSPLPGFPPSFSYPNAWDTVPSIQKYAEKLVKPPPPKTLAPAFEEDEEWKKKRSSKSWEDKVEAGSRDGDVEDEGDDSDDEVVRPGHDSDTESPRRSSSQRGSASGRRSSSGRRREVVKQYRDVGVQTDKIEVQNKDVQTNPLPQVTPRSPSRRERRPTMSGTRHWAPTTRSELLPPVTVSNVGTQADKAAVSSSPSSALRETQKRFEKQQASPPLVRRQTLSSPLATSPPIAQKQANKVPSPPVVVRRQSTGNTPTPHASSPSVAEPQRRLEKTSSPASTIRRLPIGTPPASMTPLANVPSNGRRAEKTSSPKTLSRRASTGTPPLVASPDSIPTTPKPTLRTTQSPLIPSPSPMNGQLSGESSLGSPASSAGPVSPADGQSLNSPRRKPGRVWDPARGVDLFKRGSEEVLARFLRMSSWDEEQQQ